MCVRARCTSPTGARGPAGTLCPTSLAQTVAEGSPGGGATSFVLFCLLFLCGVCLSLFSPLCFSCIRNLNRTQKALYLRFKVLLHVVSPSFAVSAVPPLTADLTLHLLYFTFLCPHLTSNTTLCASAPSLLFLPFLTGVPYNRRGLAPTGTLSVCACCRASRQTSVCVCGSVCICVCVLICSVTLPLCLPATFCLHSPFPGGTSTQKDTATHITSISL